MHLGVFHTGMTEQFQRVLAPLNLSPQVQRIVGPVLIVGGALLVWNWFRRG